MKNKTNEASFVEIKTFLLAVIVVAISGCAIFTDKKLVNEVDQYNEAQSAKMGDADVAFNNAMRDKKQMSHAFISSSAIPRAKHTLPAPFYMTYSIGIDKNQSLAAIAGEITRLSGIPVRISADVTIQQISGNQNSNTSSTVKNDAWGIDAPMDFSNATLADILNSISARLGVDWEYDEGAGVINISRLTTRVFYVPIASAASTQSASVGKNGSISSGGSSGGVTSGLSSATSATSSSTVNSTIDPWNGMKDLISGMITEKGKVTVNASMNTIVVTDVKQSVDRIEKVINRFIRQNLRSILFKVDVISVVNKNQNEIGINWKLVWKQLSSLAPNATITFNGSPAFAAQNGGGVGITLNPPLSGSPGHFDGTQAILNALSAVGKTSIVNSAFVPAMNNRLVSLALSDQVNYLESTTAVSGGSAGGTAVSLNAATATTGFILNMLPLITNERDIILQFSMDSSTLNRIDTITTADTTLQQPNISSTQMALSPKLKEGATTVLASYTRTISGDDAESLLPNVMVSGGKRISRVKQEMIVLITPIAVD